MNQNNNSNPVSPEQAEQLQSTLDQTVRDIGIPGITASVITPNGIWSGASGVANIETQEPMQTDDVLGIGSITKTFTAATVLKLEESEKLSLDDTLGQWLPDVAERIPDGENITIRQLLNGTSGIYDFTSNPQFSLDQLADFQSGSTKDWQLEDIAAYAYDKPRSDSWVYPNTGNILAGMIVEKATGKDFGDVLQEEILDPLGLKNTFYGKEGQDSIDRDRLAHGYEDLFTADSQLGQDGILEDLTNVNRDAVGSTGGMLSNTQDLARFYQALFGGELLKPESLQEMLTFVETGSSFQWGLGMENSETPWGNAISRGGNFSGYIARLEYFPELDTTVVFEGNREWSGQDSLKNIFTISAIQSSLLEASGISSPDGIMGTNCDDNLNGTPDENLIDGLEGNDSLAGEGGGDYLFGKEGNDFLDGGNDRDLLNGGLGNDTLLGRNGTDGLIGSEGEDSLDGGTGDDILDGGAGNDIVKDEEGNNSLYGNEGNDLIFAGMSDDLLYGGAGNDSLSGQGGSDRLIADAGNDTLDAGEGDDTLFGGEGHDFLIGRGGKDSLTGNEGKDLFAIASQGTVTITDFTDGQDLLQFSDGLSFADLKITQGEGEKAANTLISLDMNQEAIVTLSGVNSELVTIEDFVILS
jgi:CubicO group peptidase (beta-lactamase class C family)